MNKTEQRQILTEKYGHIGVNDGWLDLVQATLYLVEPAIERVAQIKEKFGGLRIYVDLKKDSGFDPNRIFEILDSAEARSLTICEFTGNPGKRRKCKGWIKTVSDEYYNEFYKEKGDAE